MKNNHIVYAAFDSKGNCLYVGEGKPDRYKHITSGVSHVYEANKWHFANKQVVVKILHEGLTKEQVADLQSTRMRIANGINEIYQSPLTQAWVKEEILANYATTNPSASDLSAMTTQLVKAGKLTDAGIDFIAVALVETPTAPVAEMLSTLKTIDAKQKASVADAVVLHMNLSEAQLTGENQQLISDFIKTSASKN